jgi:hypothetical protein
LTVKALACELPKRLGLPLARWSFSELRQEVIAKGIVAEISGTTLWRWLSQDAELVRNAARTRKAACSWPLTPRRPPGVPRRDRASVEADLL